MSKLHLNNNSESEDLLKKMSASVNNQNNYLKHLYQNSESIMHLLEKQNQLLFRQLSLQDPFLNPKIKEVKTRILTELKKELLYQKHPSQVIDDLKNNEDIHKYIDNFKKEKCEHIYQSLNNEYFNSRDEIIETAIMELKCEIEGSKNDYIKATDNKINDMKKEIENHFKSKEDDIEYWRSFNLDKYLQTLKSNQHTQIFEIITDLSFPCTGHSITSIEDKLTYEFGGLKQFALPKLEKQFKQRPPWPQTQEELLKSLNKQKLKGDKVYTLYDLYMNPYKLKWKKFSRHLDIIVDYYRFVIEGLTLEYKYSNGVIFQDEFYFNPHTFTLKRIRNVENVKKAINEFVMKLPQEWMINANQLQSSDIIEVKISKNKRVLNVNGESLIMDKILEKITLYLACQEKKEEEKGKIQFVRFDVKNGILFDEKEDMKKVNLVGMANTMRSTF